MQKTLRSPEYLRFIELLVAVRDAEDISQQSLAKEIGQHQSFIAKYEGGQRRIDVVEFVTIAKALRQDPVKLLATFLAEKQPPKASKKRKIAK